MWLLTHHEATITHAHEKRQNNFPMISQENIRGSFVIMGVETPMPPLQDERRCPRRGAPAADQEPKKNGEKNLPAPPCLAEALRRVTLVYL